MKHWTLGFVFTPDLSEVLLIHKKRPPHQAGRWNGLGGKFEKGETAKMCISREIKEESNLYIPAEAWKHIGHMEGDSHKDGHEEQWEIEVLIAIYTGSKHHAVSCTDEEIAWFRVHELPDTIRNLPWLIPLSTYALARNHIEFFKIRYTNSKLWI